MANFKKLKLENKDFQNLQSSKKELCTDSKQILKGIGKNEWCGICEMNFASPANLKYHISTQHNNAKKFQCKQCNKSFGYQSALISHSKRHSDERKKHQCDQCNRSFFNKNHLKDHISSIHKGNLFHCTMCNERFTQKGNMKRHVQTVHDKLGLKNPKR